MGACCCHDHRGRAGDGRYKRILIVALSINLAMFLTEIVAGVTAGSAALQADSLDFLADAANLMISLLVLETALRFRAVAALGKAASMALLGIWVLGVTVWHVVFDVVPAAHVMSTVGIAALVANGAVLILLAAYREGDANMRSVWICTRNDALGNVAVLLAAAGVFGTGRGWPDVVVATSMGCLALWGALQVARRAMGELQTGTGITAAHAT